MRKSSRVVVFGVVGALVALLGGLTFAQQQRPEPQQQTPSATCPCPGMGAGRMMGGMHGMMGGGMMGCPMMNDGVDVRVEKTKDGAVIRLSARDPAQVEILQRRALMTGLCMGADAGTMLPAAPPAPPRR